jgi:hypothetical protein
VLRRLWPGYLPAGTSATDTGFTTAVAWARQPVAGSIALLVPTTPNSRPTAGSTTDPLDAVTGGHAAYDYVVRLRRQDLVALPVRDTVWKAAVTTGDPVQADAVGVAAYRAGRLGDAEHAFAQARTAADPQIAARAGFNLAVVLGVLGRAEEAGEGVWAGGGRRWGTSDR